MERNVYNQLVRDKVPAILKEKGSVPHTRKITEEEYISELEISLEEYSARYMETGGINELCDIVELVTAIAKFKGLSVAEFEKKLKDRRAKYGSFDKRTYITSVEENDEDQDEDLKALGEMRDSIDLYAQYIGEEECDERCHCHDHEEE